MIDEVTYPRSASSDTGSRVAIMLTRVAGAARAWH